MRSLRRRLVWYWRIGPVVAGLVLVFWAHDIRTAECYNPLTQNQT